MDLQERDALNLTVLQRLEPSIAAILDSTSYVVLYQYESDGWKKAGIEGTMFLFARNTAHPRYGMYVLNRQGLNNFIRPFSGADDLEITKEYVLFRSEKPGHQGGEAEEEIWGIWVFDENERKRVCERMNKLEDMAKEDLEAFQAPIQGQQQQQSNQWQDSSVNQPMSVNASQPFQQGEISQPLASSVQYNQQSGKPPQQYTVGDQQQKQQQQRVLDALFPPQVVETLPFMPSVAATSESQHVQSMVNQRQFDLMLSATSPTFGASTVIPPHLNPTHNPLKNAFDMQQHTLSTPAILHLNSLHMPHVPHQGQFSQFSNEEFPLHGLNGTMQSATVMRPGHHHQSPNGNQKTAIGPSFASRQAATMAAAQFQPPLPHAPVQPPPPSRPLSQLKVKPGTKAKLTEEELDAQYAMFGLAPTAKPRAIITPQIKTSHAAPQMDLKEDFPPLPSCNNNMPQDRITECIKTVLKGEVLKNKTELIDLLRTKLDDAQWTDTLWMGWLQGSRLD